ncbi:MAG: hypothetical protein JWM44_2662 [Bacilli bacterium]|nr:hypothetical protein [Bacilli bacterium]
MNNRVVPLKSPHTIVRGDANMENKIFSRETEIFIAELLAKVLKRAIANGTYKPIQKASGE